MKRVLFCCALVLACLMAVSLPSAVLSATTTVSGTIPLTIREVGASAITCDSAVITWETNGYSTSQVFYDTVPHEDLANYANRVESNDLVSIHNVSLNGLSSGTSYYYAVKSVLTEDGNSLTAVEDNLCFTTLTPGNALTIISPPNGKLQSGEVGEGYSEALVACGGTPDYTWRIAKGCLPCGLSLSASTGVISGIPVKAGTSKFSVQVSDKAGATATAALSINIKSGPPICTASPPKGEESVWATVCRSAELLVSIPGSLISGLLA